MSRRSIDRHRRPWGPIVLALSLGLNVFLAGWTLSQGLPSAALGWLGGANSYAHPGPAPETVAEVIAAALPTADAALLRQAVAAEHDALAEARRDYLARSDQLRGIVAAESLDAEALKVAVAEMRTARQAERTLLSNAIVDSLLKMSYQGRQAFVATHLGGRP